MSLHSNSSSWMQSRVRSALWYPVIDECHRRLMTQLIISAFSIAASVSSLPPLICVIKRPLSGTNRDSLIDWNTDKLQPIRGFAFRKMSKLFLVKLTHNFILNKTYNEIELLSWFFPIIFRAHCRSGGWLPSHWSRAFLRKNLTFGVSASWSGK